MISIEGVPEPGSVTDVFEGSLFVPIPGPDKNTIVMEDRDGGDVKRLTATAAYLDLNKKTVFKLEGVKIDIFITDARVAFACSKFAKGGGWIGGPVGMVVLNAGSKALAALRRRGKMMVGQVRYPWVRHVGSTSRRGWGSEERLVFYAKSPDKDQLKLTLILPRNIDAASAAAEIARRTAAYRLAAETEFEDDERTKLEALTRAERLTASSADSKNKVMYFDMPTFWPIGEKSARLVPAKFSGAASGGEARAFASEAAARASGSFLSRRQT